MSQKINDAIMENVENLSKLSLTAQEREKTAKEMEKILSYVEKLNELDTEGEEPLIHILDEGSRFREDEVTNGNGRDEALANAPGVADGQYTVPRTV